MDELRIERLVDLFKLLADPARLRILGAIAERPLTGKELSERLRLTPPTISHHMARLVEAELVRATPEGTSRRYALDEGVLRDLSREVAGRPNQPDTTSADPEDQERAKVLRDFFVEGRLKQIPAQRKKRVIVLQHLLTRFLLDREYPEREVNDRLREVHEDVATLRRELVDYGFMVRDRGIYRIASALPARGPTVGQEITGDERGWLRAIVEGATTRAIAGEPDQSDNGEKS